VPASLPPARPRIARLTVSTLTVLVVLYVIGSLTGQLTKHFVLANAGQLLLSMGAVGLAIRQAKHTGWSRSWLLLSAGLLMMQFTGLAHLIGSLLSSDHSTSWFSYAVYFAAYPLIFAGLLFLPRNNAQTSRSHGLETLGGWLDFAIVLLAGGMAVTFLWVIPALRVSRADTLTSVFITANALGDILVLAAVTRYALLKHRNLPPAATLMIVVGGLAALASDVVMGAETAHGSYTAGGTSARSPGQATAPPSRPTPVRPSGGTGRALSRDCCPWQRSCSPSSCPCSRPVGS
jgi:hypothetical protein